MAGFDTTATTLANSAYLLAKNPDVQDKLYDQVVEKIKQPVSFQTFLLRIIKPNLLFVFLVIKTISKDA